MKILHDVTIRELTANCDYDTIINRTGIMKIQPEKIKVWTMAKYCRR